MKPFEKCPICNGEIVQKHVQELVRGGHHTASVSVDADVCLHCGERLYSPATVRKFEEIRGKLEREALAGFTRVGQFFEVVL
jgi:YgiT-type zinc finger domain-containing protein